MRVGIEKLDQQAVGSETAYRAQRVSQWGVEVQESPSLTENLDTWTRSRSCVKSLHLLLCSPANRQKVVYLDPDPAVSSACADLCILTVQNQSQ